MIYLHKKMGVKECVNSVKLAPITYPEIEEKKGFSAL